MRIPIAFSDSEMDQTSSIAKTMVAARTAQARWSCTTVEHRLKLVQKLRHLITENGLQLAESSASVRKRPALESLTAEVLPLVEACRFLEREAVKLLARQRLGKRHRPLWLAGVQSEIRREPFGVILVIGPGNYPLLLPGVQVIQALVAGNAVLLKPGVGGMNVAQALCELLVRAGFDPHLINLLSESPVAAREAIAARPDKVVFTGSAFTGEKILAQLAPQLIPATMELSGCDAVIIRVDADLDLTVKALKFALTLNNGATCMSPKRVFVARSIATELEGRLARTFSSHKNQSQLTSETAEQLRPLLDDALSRGAHYVAGGISGGGAISVPIILGGVSPSSRLLKEDIFASVVSIVTVTDDDEMIAQVNHCPFALGASIFSRDESTAHILATRIHTGVVTINDLLLPTADARVPFGGRGRSGFGSTRGAEGLLELTTQKVVTITRGKFRPAFEPPQLSDEQLFQAYLKLAHGHGIKLRWNALASLVRNLSRRRKSFSQKKL